MNSGGTNPASRAGCHYLLLALAGILPFVVNGPINAQTAGRPMLYWSFELLIWVALPALIWFAAARTPGFRPADLGFHTAVLRYRGPAAVAVAAAVFAPLCYFFYLGAYDFFASRFASDAYFEYESVIPERGLPRHAVIAYFALSAGLVEEFLFRGLLFRAARAFRYPALVFVIVSPLLFGLVHWESGSANLYAAWAYGLFTAGAYLLLKNLWPLIAGHVLTDLLWFA